MMAAGAWSARAGAYDPSMCERDDLSWFYLEVATGCAAAAAVGPSGRRWGRRLGRHHHDHLAERPRQPPP